jgi:hypothetical protein
MCRQKQVDASANRWLSPAQVATVSIYGLTRKGKQSALTPLPCLVPLAELISAYPSNIIRGGEATKSALPSILQVNWEHALGANYSESNIHDIIGCVVSEHHAMRVNIFCLALT